MNEKLIKRIAFLIFGGIEEGARTAAKFFELKGTQKMKSIPSERIYITYVNMYIVIMSTIMDIYVKDTELNESIINEIGKFYFDYTEWLENQVGKVTSDITNIVCNWPEQKYIYDQHWLHTQEKDGPLKAPDYNRIKISNIIIWLYEIREPSYRKLYDIDLDNEFSGEEFIPQLPNKVYEHLTGETFDLLCNQIIWSHIRSFKEFIECILSQNMVEIR